MAARRQPLEKAERRSRCNYSTLIWLLSSPYIAIPKRLRRPRGLSYKKGEGGIEICFANLKTRNTFCSSCFRGFATSHPTLLTHIFGLGFSTPTFIVCSKPELLGVGIISVKGRVQRIIATPYREFDCFHRNDTHTWGLSRYSCPGPLSTAI